MNTMLEYKGYHASIEYDAEDNIFVGEVFGIADSLNFHGTSIDELKATFTQCIDNYLELCKKIGKNPDKEFKGTFNVRIPPALHKKAALAAANQKITLNQYVTQAIENSFNKDKNFKETIIYIPYATQHMDWESGINNRIQTLYNDDSIFTTEEKITYVRN